MNSYTMKHLFEITKLFLAGYISDIKTIELFGSQSKTTKAYVLHNKVPYTITIQVFQVNEINEKYLQLEHLNYTVHIPSLFLYH
jgi:hypothetical protein